MPLNKFKWFTKLYIHIKLFVEIALHVLDMSLSGLPLVVVGGWSLTRALVDDSHCWLVHTQRWVFWAFIRAPVAFSVVLNFVFFINVVRVLALKLRTPGVANACQKYR